MYDNRLYLFLYRTHVIYMFLITDLIKITTEKLLSLSVINR